MISKNRYIDQIYHGYVFEYSFSLVE